MPEKEKKQTNKQKQTLKQTKTLICRKWFVFESLWSGWWQAGISLFSAYF